MSRPDQIDDESREEGYPNDEDSIMEDATNNADTPQTSLATSDSQCPSEEPTRTSTPTENRAEDVPVDNFPLRLLEHDDVSDDVTMKDDGQRVRSPTSAPDDLGTSKSFSWPSNGVFDPGSSPGKAGQRKYESVDYAADPQNFEEPVQTDDFYEPNLYRL